MDLKIINLFNKGNHASEHVLLKARRDIPDLQFYAICDNTFNPNGTLSNKERHLFWFPSHSVDAGEYVSLWTCRGRNTIIDDTARNRIVHRFYWGLRSSIWNKTGDQAVLFDLSAFTQFNV